VPQIDHLGLYMERIRDVFDVEAVLRKDITHEQIIEYYTNCSPAYSIFHSIDGAVHMALTSDKVIQRYDYFTQAHFVATHLTSQINTVLELGSGKGFNCLYLSEKFTDIEFVGLDLTPLHVKIANQKSGINARFILGDFHYTQLPQSDLIFEVEALCHTDNLSLLLDNVYKTLRTGGKFILFDSFRDRSPQGYTQAKALELIEKSMALHAFPRLDDFKSTAIKSGFEIHEVVDISDMVMPNLLRLQNLAKIYFTSPIVSKVIKLATGHTIATNAIAGLLMPIASEEKWLPYYRIVLSK
jgi:arsenite methyltransferase